MSFGLIDRRIFESSVAVNPMGRVVLMDMVTLADENDNVMMTMAELSRVTRWSPEVLEETTKYLSSPDPESKSSLEEGRRITPILNHTGTIIGWHVVNRHYWKRIAFKSRRSQYMRTYRAKKQEEDWAKRAAEGRS